MYIYTQGRGVDADLKGDALYDGDPDTGFKLGGTDADKMEAKYTAFAAEGGSYVIEGSVTNLTNGDVITKRVTVNVQELAKEAWILTGAEAEVMYQLDYDDSGDEAHTDTETGLTKQEMLGYPLITATELGKLDAKTTKKGHLLNKMDDSNEETQGAKPALADAYNEPTEISEAGADKLEKTKFTLAYINDDGDAVLIKTADALLEAVANDDQAENKTIVKLTNNTEVDVTVDAGKIAKAAVATLKKETLTSKDLLAVQPKYAARLTLGQDAYDKVEVGGGDFETITSQKGVDTSYSIEMVDSMGFADNNKKTARLAAKMGGLFAGYVNQDGTIGEGKVLPLITKRIVNLGVVPAGETVNQKLDNYWGIGIETFFGKNIAKTAEVDTDDEDDALENLTYLFDVNDGTTASASLDPTLERNVETTFWTVSPEPEDGTYDFYTKETDEIKKLADDDFARVGQYKVVFSFWYAKSTKPVEESKTFSVKNDLYVPGVQVKTQTIDSYTQSGWKEAVVSEVDLNNNDPYTYSVIDLEDKTGTTINDSKTPAKWAVVTEEGVHFHVPLDRTFKLS